MKHNARLPRTAGLRTISELSTSMTRAGLDPSRIEQRAELIAKARGLERKRKRDEEMDVDEEGSSGEDEDAEGEEAGDWMDVDGEGDDGRSPPKRRKSNTGTTVTAVGKHAPRTNRQTAGMRDQTQVSKAIKLRNLGQRERNMHAKAGESDRAIKTKMVSRLHPRVHSTRLSRPIFSQSICFLGNEKGERLRDDEFSNSLVFVFRLCFLFLSSVYPVVVCFLVLLCILSSHTHVTVAPHRSSHWSVPQNLPVPCVHCIMRLAKDRYKRIDIYVVYSYTRYIRNS